MTQTNSRGIPCQAKLQNKNFRKKRVALLPKIQRPGHATKPPHLPRKLHPCGPSSNTAPRILNILQRVCRARCSEPNFPDFNLTPSPRTTTNEPFRVHPKMTPKAQDHTGSRPLERRKNTKPQNFFWGETKCEIGPKARPLQPQHTDIKRRNDSERKTRRTNQETATITLTATGTS